MGHLFDEVCAESTLMNAWVAMRPKDGHTPAPGHVRFSRTAASSIARIAADLASGTWQPRHPTEMSIPRSDGSFRVLRVPSVGDRVVQRAILDVIDPIIDSHLLPWVFGYRRGLGVRDAVDDLVARRDAGDRFVVRADVDDCFDQIPHRRLIQRLTGLLRDEDLVAVIARILESSHPDGRGVGQGSPLAPLLSNVYLAAMDEAMAARGIHVIRYADDLALPAPTLDAAEHALALLISSLDEIDLSLEPAKTRIVDMDDGVEFLGTRISASTASRDDRFDTPLTGTVYVTSPGTYLRRRGQRLRIVTDESEHSIGLDRIRQVVVFGPAGLTTPVLTAILERGVELSLLSDQGRYFGRLQGATTGDPHLRAAQYRRGDRPHESLDVAQRIIAAKITNQRNLLLRRQRSSGVDLGKTPTRLAELREKVTRTEHVSSLLGVEGAASREYFGALGKLLTPEFVFEGRRRRPPPDPVNSMLSFGYTLLLQEVIGAVELAGLDPSEGTVHSRLAGRPSLALDLMEEFRSTVVDTIVLALAKRHSVRSSDFVLSDTAPVRCTMTKSARDTFLRAYEQRMLTLAVHPGTGRRVSYRVMLALQAKAYAVELRDPSRKWHPAVWK